MVSRNQPDGRQPLGIVRPAPRSEMKKPTFRGLDAEAMRLLREPPYAVLAMAAVMVALFVLPIPDVVGKLALTPDGVIERHELYRVVTCGFVHARLPHLVLNLVILLLTGWLCEKLFGPWWTLGLFMSGVIGGSLFHLALADSRGYGASGGTFALSAAAATFSSLRWKSMPDSIQRFVPVAFIGLFAEAGESVHHVNQAHLGGVFIGILVGGWLAVRARRV